MARQSKKLKVTYIQIKEIQWKSIKKQRRRKKIKENNRKATESKKLKGNQRNLQKSKNTYRNLKKTKENQ